MTHPQKLLPTRMIVSTRGYWRVRLRVLTSTIASIRVFICKYSRVILSLELASFDSRVGYASLACTRSHWRLVFACDIASDTSHLYTWVYTKKFLWRLEKSFRSPIQNAVGRVSQNRDFFSEAWVDNSLHTAVYMRGRLLYSVIY